MWLLRKYDNEDKKYNINILVKYQNELGKNDTPVIFATPNQKRIFY